MYFTLYREHIAFPLERSVDACCTAKYWLLIVTNKLTVRVKGGFYC